jgi:hypothetical protein
MSWIDKKLLLPGLRIGEAVLQVKEILAETEI